MQLSRTVAYAVQATLQLAGRDSDAPVPCSRLAADGKMPERFLLQILRNLVNHGILESSRGIEGGYVLNRAPEDVSLLEVIEAIDGPMKANLPRQGGLPSESHSRLQEALRSITDVSRSQLEAIKLAQLMPSPKGKSRAKAK